MYNGVSKYLAVAVNGHARGSGCALTPRALHEGGGLLMMRLLTRRLDNKGAVQWWVCVETRSGEGAKIRAPKAL